MWHMLLLTSLKACLLIIDPSSRSSLPFRFSYTNYGVGRMY